MTQASNMATEGELDFRAIGRAVWRKKLWVLLPTIIVAALTFLGVNLITPRYKSEARILIDGRENVFLRPEAEKSGERDRTSVDQEAVTSQVQLVLSRDLARQVAKELKLNEKPEFDPVLRGVNPLRQLLTLVGIAKDPLRFTPEERIFEAYYDRLQAYQVEKSRVIAIEFQSADPELAARGANVIAEAFLGLQRVVKQDQTRAASQWLAGEIENLRPKVAEAEAKVEDFRTKSNLFMGTGTHSLSNQQLGELSSQLAVARSQQAETDAKAQLIREMLRSGRAIESAEIVNSELIRRLNEQRVTLRAQLAEQSSTLLDRHPRIKELRAQIADLDRLIKGEAERLVRSLENDAKIAGARVEQLSANVEQLKRHAASSNGQDVQLRALERDAKSQRDLLETYLAKYREANARETLSASPADARIISRAVVSNTPYFPKKLPIVLIAAFATMLLTAGFITTGELVAGSAHRPVVEGRPGAPAEREAPALESAQAALHAVWSEPSQAAPAADDYSVTAVAAKLRASADGRSRAIVVSLGAEARLVAPAIGLARALALQARVVLVDLAFSAPNVAAITGDPAAPGIADLVRGTASFDQVIGGDRASRLHVIAAGRAGEDAAAMLRSERLAIALDALARTYEHVIIDAGMIRNIPMDTLGRLAPRAILAVSDRVEDSVLSGVLDDLHAAGFAEPMVLVAKPIPGEETAPVPAAA